MRHERHKCNRTLRTSTKRPGERLSNRPPTGYDTDARESADEGQFNWRTSMVWSMHVSALSAALSNREIDWENMVNAWFMRFTRNMG
jgi:hypothetical protein